MKKSLLFLIISFLVLPLGVFAEERISLTCDKLEAKKNEELECQIVANDLEFILTSVTGKIKLDDNLELIGSSYDENVFKMLDDEFSVENINLMSEELEKNSNILIASFKVKANNEETITSKISFEEVLLGDDNYESHEMNVESIDIYLENVKVSNPNTDISNPAMICCIVLAGAGIGYFFLKKKKYI